MSFTPRTAMTWQLRSRTVELGPRTRILGILNLTPDSFSDGGRFLDPDGALRHALQMLDDGADLLDLGAESTRPSATPITAEEEQDRLLPTLRAILQQRPDAILSVDTYHAPTARLALEAGAEIINDISGLTWDPGMATICAAGPCGLILMHTRGHPRGWASLPPLPSITVMPVILTGLRDCLLTARTAGIPSSNIVLDPGLGFGKRGDENFIVLALLNQLRQFGLPVVVGSSRKGFLRHPLTDPPPAPDSPSSLYASLAALTAAILAGAHLIRVHDVRPARDAATVADRILAAAETASATSSTFTRATSSVPQ